MDLGRLAGWTIGSALLVSGSVAVGGCSEPDDLGAAADSGDEGDTEGDTEGEGSTEQLIADIATTQCSFIDGCGCVNREGGQACEDEVTATWEARLADGAARGLTFDASCMDQTLARMGLQECRFNESSIGHVCNSFCAVYSGTQALGAACTSSDPQVSDCAQGLVCWGGACEEPCNVLTGMPEGATCRAEEFGEQFDDCAGGLYCDWESQQCIRGAAFGEPCQNNECGEGLYCDWQADACRLEATEGESCQTRECVDGLFCDWEFDICRARGQLGDSCDNVPCAEGWVCNGTVCAAPPNAGSECLSGSCAAGALCDWNNEIPMCVTAPRDGQPCLFGGCEEGLWCDFSDPERPDGLCTLPVAYGEACSGHLQCETVYCPAGYCLDRPGLGEDCSGAGVCARGLVCDGATCLETDNRAPAACVYKGW